MSAVEQGQSAYHFGVFELNPHTRELRKSGAKLKLQDQPFRLLLILLEHPGEIVTREEIQKYLWPENTYVDFDNAINSSVRKLRDVLGDNADNPRFIETLARRGYRFIAPLNGSPPVKPVRSSSPEARERRLPVHKRLWVVLAAVAVLIMGVGILYERHLEQNRTASDALPPPVPLTTYPGFQWSPSFSPDETRVAFTWDEPGKRRPSIYVKLIGPSDPIRLTSGEESDFAPAWSPDGRWIAFLRAKGQFSMAIMLIPSLGGTARELVRLQLNMSRLIYYGHQGWSASRPFLAWSLDGRWLLALEQSGPEGPAPETRVRIVRISVDGGEKSPFLLSLDADQNQNKGGPPLMRSEEGLAVSPDGKKLAFIHKVDFSNTGVYVLTLTDEMMPAGPPRSLHFDKGECNAIAWDADGRSLIVSSDRRGPRELWRVPVNLSVEPSRLAISDDFPEDLAVSKTGQRLAYTHSSQDPNIWRVDLTNAHLKDAAAFIASTRNEYHPSYSPDGKRIAFESNRFGNEEIWVSDANGVGAVQLTSFRNAYAGTPRWSPDGQQIAFDSNAARQWDIYVIPSQGGKPIRLTSGSGSKTRPSWSQDGKWIYYCGSGGGSLQIWKKAAIGGAEMQITKNGGCNQMESPDGRYVYYLNKDESALWRVPVTGGEEVELAELGPEAQFTVGKHGVYFVSSIDANTLKFLEYATGSIKVLGALPGPVFPGLAVSPDEHWLLYGKSDWGGSQLLLVEKFR
jgi:Tol biopolymer transport system component/DNA-binding winged helix-turn-helix (wHTH) protein